MVLCLTPAHPIYKILTCSCSGGLIRLQWNILVTDSDLTVISQSAPGQRQRQDYLSLTLADFCSEKICFNSQKTQMTKDTVLFFYSRTLLANFYEKLKINKKICNQLFKYLNWSNNHPEDCPLLKCKFIKSFAVGGETPELSLNSWILIRKQTVNRVNCWHQWK